MISFSCFLQIFSLILAPILLPLAVVVAPVGIVCCCIIRRKSTPPQNASTNDVELGVVTPSAPRLPNDVFEPIPSTSASLFGSSLKTRASRWLCPGDFVWDPTRQSGRRGEVLRNGDDPAKNGRSDEDDVKSDPSANKAGDENQQDEY